MHHTHLSERQRFSSKITDNAREQGLYWTQEITRTGERSFCYEYSPQRWNTLRSSNHFWIFNSLNRHSTKIIHHANTDSSLLTKYQSSLSHQPCARTYLFHLSGCYNFTIKRNSLVFGFNRNFAKHRLLPWPRVRPMFLNKLELVFGVDLSWC